MKAPVFSISALALMGALVAGMVAWSPPARAQDVQSLADTVSRLERQLQTLERNIYRGGGASPAAVSGGAAPSGTAPSPAGTAQLNVRVDAIEDQLRQVTGEVERVSHDVRQLSQRLDKLVTDYDYRLRSLEKGAPAGSAQSGPGTGLSTAAADGAGQPAPGGTSPQPGTIGTLTESQLKAANVQPPAADAAAGQGAAASAGQQTASTGSVSLPAGDPSTQYEYAFSYLMRRDFPGAEQAFRQFVDAHPDDPLAGNAQYWLGETYYVRNDFPAAARTFAEGFQRYPDSSKAADNLLKLGLSLAALDRKDDACITFAKLSTSYPGAAANILQRAKKERARLGCG